MRELVSCPPPAKPEGLLYINRLKAGKSVRGVIISPEPFGVSTHYVDERSRLCLDNGACNYCEHGLGKRWKGYLTFVGYGLHARPELLEVTPDLVSQISAINPHKESMRGWEFAVKRGGSDNSRLHLEALIPKTPNPNLPANPDVVPTIVAFFLQ